MSSEEEGMAVAIGRSRSRFVAFVAVFTALAAVLDALPVLPGFYSGIWDSWLFLLSPLLGVLLGPAVAAISIGLGSLLGHFIYFRDPYEFLFMLGAPVGAAIAALVYQRRWRPVVLLYTAMLAAYFLTPVTWLLPLIGIWDTLVGYGAALIFALLVVRGWIPKPEEDQGRLILLPLGSLIGLEADVLFRIFLFIPCQTYWLFYSLGPQQLQLLWLGAGIITPLKVAMAAGVTVSLGLPLLRLLPRLGLHPPSKLGGQTVVASDRGLMKTRDNSN